MSGHSKWSTIKRAKAVSDSKKSKIFSKLARAISVAAKKGGGDVNANSTLRLYVEKAKEARMPKENVDRAIQKGLGVLGGTVFEEVVYEGYGPKGVAFMVAVLTDNRNRTVSEIRNTFSRYGGSLGGIGSTAYIFQPDPENPTFTVEIEDVEEAKKLLMLAEALEENDDVQELYTNFNIKEELVNKS